MTVSDEHQRNQPSEVDRARDETERRKRSKQSASSARIAYQHEWVDQQVRVAMANGEFDDLPGAGKPIEGLGGTHDPDWWLKKLVEREQISVLPASLQLRKDDAELDDRLAGLSVERDVRREVEDFNARVIRARYTPADGTPPLITMPRDTEATLAAWRARREDLALEQAERRAAAQAAAPPPSRRWWRRTPRG